MNDVLILLWISFIINIILIFLLIKLILSFRQKVDIYENWISEFAKTVQAIEHELDILDSQGTYRSQDEIGFFYQSLYSILKRLHDYGLVSELPQTEIPKTWRESQRFKVIQRTRNNDIEIEDIQRGRKELSVSDVIVEPDTLVSNSDDNEISSIK